MINLTKIRLGVIITQIFVKGGILCLTKKKQLNIY